MIRAAHHFHQRQSLNHIPFLQMLFDDLGRVFSQNRLPLGGGQFVAIELAARLRRRF